MPCPPSAELHQVWHAAISPHWMELRARMETHRAAGLLPGAEQPL
ncbi:hypothetical protein [Streptacidiphilus sp. EB129]